MQTSTKIGKPLELSGMFKAVVDLVVPVHSLHDGQALSTSAMVFLIICKGFVHRRHHEWRGMHSHNLVSKKKKRQICIFILFLIYLFLSFFLFYSKRDVFYKKYRWMLCYWNLDGVPVVYCILAFYLYKAGVKKDYLKKNIYIYTIRFEKTS